MSAPGQITRDPGPGDGAGRRFLFLTIQGRESVFYGRVGRELRLRGHDVLHVTVSRRSAHELNAAGERAHCLGDLLTAVPDDDPNAAASRIESRYGLPAIRDVWVADPACERWPEDRSLKWTVRHFAALERLFDRERPQVVIPEVGREVMRTVAHLIAVNRNVPVLFLMYTVFPQPLRLYADTMHAPIVPPGEVRELNSAERDEIETFISEYRERAEPIRKHRRIETSLSRVPEALAHVRDRLGIDRDNPYLRPAGWAASEIREVARRVVAPVLYSRPGRDRQFVYFPLHVTDDYKIKRLIPHCVDQASIVEQIADSLPHGYDLVLKEHPMSVGRNRLSLLRRLTRRRNVRILHPRTNSHELIDAAAAVAVISSTVGLEALMYNKPVLTLGQPFYAGYGVTVDVDSFREIRSAVPALLEFRPERELILRLLHASMRRCYPGAPVLVDESNNNVIALAGSLERAARDGVPGTYRTPETVQVTT
jgi:hypothetical protein